MSPIYIVAFSGHRSEEQVGRSPRELEQCRELIKTTLFDLRSRTEKVGGNIHLFSSAAEGADLIACQIAIDERIPLHLILPLNPEDFKTDYTRRPEGMHQWTDVEKVIAHCNSEQNNSTLRIADTSHHRPDCYAETNLQLLDSADVLLVVWNGLESDSDCGTHAAWRAAEAKGLPRVHLNPNATAEPASPIELENFAPENDPGLEIVNSLLPGSLPQSCDSIQTISTDLDKQADNHSKSTRKQTRHTIVLHGIASFLAAAGISYALAGGPNPQKVLPFIALIELIFIGAAIWIHRQLHHHGEQWIHFRFGAELLRPLHLVVPYLDPLTPLISSHRPNWHRFLLTIGLSQPCEKLTELKDAKDAYLTGRINDQIGHFTKKGTEATSTATILYNIMRWSTIVAFVSVLIAVIYKFSHFNDAPHGLPSSFLASLGSFLLYLLPVALPLLSGILLSYRLSFDLGRRKLRYPQMIESLERAEVDLHNAVTPMAFRQVVTRTEEILIDELNEFHTSQRVGFEH